MSPQPEATSLVSAALNSEAFQSIATELMIFGATIAVAVVLKVTMFRSSCSPSYLDFFQRRRKPAKKSYGTSISSSCKSSAEHFSPSTEPPRNLQAGNGARKPKVVTQGPARIIEDIMDRAWNKNAAEALSLYTELRSGDRLLAIKDLIRSTRHTGLDFFSALIQSAVRAGRPEVTEQLINDMVAAEIERTLSFYESAMKVLAGKKHYSQALAIYDRLTSEGLKASPVTLSCLINFTAELGDFDRSIKFFEQLSACSTPSIRAYMVALRVHSKRQDWNKSLEIFRSMQERGVQIDSLILNSLLSTGSASGKIEATEALLHEVASSRPELIDVISYNTVLKGYAHQKVADKALAILDVMLERGAYPAR